MPQVMEKDTDVRCVINSHKLHFLSPFVFFAGWCCFIRLPGDLFYYSYPPSSPVCGQISRLYAALLPILSQASSRLWTLAVQANTTLQTLPSAYGFYFYHISIVLKSSANDQMLCDDMMMYFCYRWSNVFTNVFFFVGGLLVSIVDKK